jgi:hypothetical protein
MELDPGEMEGDTRGLMELITTLLPSTVSPADLHLRHPSPEPILEEEEYVPDPKPRKLRRKK